MICPSCGSATPEGARFCPSCGHQLVVQIDERRVVTVLFADLVGFTGLAESRDPEQVKLLVDSYFEELVDVIRRFGGRVDKIVGDAIVALFGAPVAHEDDPERAVRAALRMQETLVRRSADLPVPVQMRIGVNTGEVLTGALRAGGDYTAMGDVVNTASRLQTTAAPGEVLVGATTHVATAEVIAYEPVGPIAMRGRDDAVEAWRAVSALLPPGYGRRATRTPLIGRSGEMDLIGHALDACVERRRAALVTLLGEAGVGKSRLAREVSQLAEQRHGALIMQGRSVAYGEANVWWPVAEAIRSGIGATHADPPSVVRTRLTTALEQALATSSDQDDIERTTNGLIHVMGLDGPLRRIDPQRAREEVTRSVVRFLEAHLRKRPVMMVIADLHWAGAPVRELLAATLERLVDMPFMLLTTARPPFRESWAPANGRHNTLVVNVDPLGRDASRALLDALSGDRIEPSLRDDLLDRSGGNPLFLEELIALISEDSRHLNPPAFSDVDRLPDTLRGLVAARLDSLTQAERRALEDAAVYGREGSVDALVLMAAADRAGHGRRNRAEVEAAVDGLVEKEILVVDEAANEYTFRSDLVRDVAYNMMTKAARALRHYGIGEYLKAHFTWGTEVSDGIVDGLAHNYGAAAQMAQELGGVPGIPKDIATEALRWIVEAARRAEAGAVPVVAERLFDRAVRLAGPDPSAPRIELLLGRAHARAEMRLLEQARTDVDEAIGIADQIDDAAGHARALLILGSIEDKEGAPHLAIETYAAAEAEFAARGDRTGQAEALRLRGMAELFSGDTEGARRSMRAALNLFTSTADKRGEAWALQNLAWLAFLEGRPTDADRRINESVAKFEELGDSGGLGWAMGLKGWVRFHQGLWTEAEELGEGVLLEARGRGDEWAEGMMLLLTASIRLWSGRAGAAVERATEALEAFRSVMDTEREIQAAAVLGRALIAVGNVGEGFRTIDLAVERGRGHRGSAATLGPTAAASAAVSIGDPERALRAAAQISVDQLDPSVVDEGDRLVALGLALAQLGQLDDAMGHLRQAVSPGLEERPTGYALSGLCCVLAMAGEVSELEELSHEVLVASRSTYLDRITALLARAAVRYGLGHTGAGEKIFTDAETLADSTDDRVAQALVRLARAEVCTAAGSPDMAHSVEAGARLADLGIDASGWKRVFRTAAEAAGAVARASMG